MPLAVTCGCGKKYQVRDELAGKRVKCPACGGVLIVPSKPSSAGSLLDDLSWDEVARPEAAGQPLSAPPLRKRQSRDVNVPLIVGFGAGAVVLFVVILLAIVLWPSSHVATQPSAAVPQVPRDRAVEPQVPSTSEPPAERSRRARAPVRPRPAPALAKDATKTVPVQLTTNVAGTTFVVLDGQTKQELHRLPLEGGLRSQQVDLPSDGQFVFEAHIGREVIQRKALTADSKLDVALLFDPLMVREICRLAVCLIRDPDGGFGSGFLLGDRQTVVTAAHVLATPRVEQLEVIFEPAERQEERHTGARLIYFDAKQDVALMRLPQPASAERPFLWHAESQFDSSGVLNQANVIVIGNPGRGDDFDPLFIRNAKIVAGRPDEFQLDVELQPGNSGGPVCLADTGQVVGLVSYKISAAMNYQDVGRSFAKSADIATDALQNWTSMSPERQEDRITRLADRFARQYGYRCAIMAAINMIIDSAVYTDICMGVALDYQRYIDEVMSTIVPGTRMSIVRARIRKAHKEYIKERAPKKAQEVKDEVSPRLRPETKKWYDAAIADTALPEPLKDQLKKTYQHYSELKEAAEQIVDPQGRTGGGKNIQEFGEWVLKRWNDASSNAMDVATAAASGLDL